VELLWQGIFKAVELVFGGDKRSLGHYWLSLKISASATLISLLLGHTSGHLLALAVFPSAP